MYKRFINFVMPRPMIMVSILFILGIIFQSTFNLSVGIIVIFTCIALVCAVRIEKLRVPLCFALVVISGCFRVALDDLTPITHLMKFGARTDSVYRVKSVIIDVGETRRGNPRYLLEPINIDDREISDGSIILYTKDIDQQVFPGDTLIGSLLLNTPRSKRNPHEFDYQKFLKSKNIYYEAFLENPGDIEIMRRGETSLSLLLLDIKQYITAHFNEYLTPHSAGILSALILGEKSDIDESTRNDFANTGVVHVLAVSGLHVGYVSLILITIFGLLRFPYKLKMTSVMLGLILYVGLTGGAPSVMRASIMASLVIVAGLIERKSDILNLLATAAFIILMISPKQLGNIGFQLSFLAVLSIVTLFPIFKERVNLLFTITSPISSKVLTAILDLFFVSLAAQLGTLAITIYYFHKIPIVSLVANMVVVPLIGIIVATGMSFLLLGSLFPYMAKLWAATLEGAIDFMLWFVQQCAQVDWAYVTTRSIHWYELLILILVVFAVTILKARVVIRFWIILGLMWGSVHFWRELIRAPDLEVVMLDVGQGDAILIHAPNDKTILVDAGLRFGGKDMGRDVIAPYLRHRNWPQIDLLILTHPHNDHMGGAQYLVENYPIGRILMPDIEYDSYGYNKLRESIDIRKIPTSQVFAGHIDSSLKPIYFRITGPKLYDHESQPSNVNNTSLVMQLFYGEATMMLTGDGEEHVERDQLALGKLLRCDIIKAPHHGSKTSSSQAYLNLIQPDICLISLGKNNKFKHPSPITLDKYAKLGTEVFRTDIEGALIYRSDGKVWYQQKWKSDN